jgi:predicted phage terminase large subunit-like protein
VKYNSLSNASLDRISTEKLMPKLSPAGRRIFLERLLRQDFSVFVRKVFETVSPGDEFLPNWHINAMTYEAERIVEGKTKRLIVTVPPRHLKSIIFSVALPAFRLGRDPTARIICVSYSNALAVKHANDFRAVLGSSWYQRAFPGTRLSRTKNTEDETMTTALGFRLATSITGMITGRGAHLIVIDDPQKPDEALSNANRESVGQWFDNTLLSRLDATSKGAIVIVMQRLHEDDLAGRQLDKGGWRHLKIPAIAVCNERVQIGHRKTFERKAGTAIDPRRETLEDLERQRHQMGELLFSAQYQQEPIPLAGNIIKAEWFKEYDVAPTCGDNDQFVISIDTAMKGDPGADYSVATVWLGRGDYCYLLDLWRQRVEYPNLKHALDQLRKRYPTATLLIEDKGSGTSLIQELRANTVAVIGIAPEGDKVTRAAKVSAQFEAGAVLFPKTADWLSGLKAELLGFPNVKHDDQVDSVTQALSWLWQNRKKQVPWVAPIIVTAPRRYFGDPPENWWQGY